MVPPDWRNGFNVLSEREQARNLRWTLLVHRLKLLKTPIKKPVELPPQPQERSSPDPNPEEFEKLNGQGQPPEPSKITEAEKMVVDTPRLTSEPAVHTQSTRAIAYREQKMTEEQPPKGPPALKSDSD